MMKKLLLTAITTTMLWSASLDMELYNKALGEFQAKNYQESYRDFSLLFTENMDNLLVNFYLGRSAYELGEYESALSAYERVLLYDPNNTRTRVELAQTYLQMKLFAQARKEFEIALESDLPLEVRKRVEARIAFLEQKETRHFFDISLFTGLIYDSNVNATTDRGSFEIYNPYLGTNMMIQSDEEADATLIAQLFVPVSYKYKLADIFRIDTSVVAGTMRYNDYKNRDIDLASLQVTPAVYLKKYKLSLGLMYDLIYLGHEKYQSNYYLRPALSTLLSNNLLYEVAMQVGEINYELQKERSSEFYSLANSLRYASQSAGIFDFALTLAKEEESYSPRTDVSLFYADLRAANSFDFWSSYMLRTSVLYRYTKYDEEDVNFLTKREDKRLDYSLELQKMFGDNLALSLGGVVSDVASNQKPFEYDKYNIKLNLSYGF